MLYLTKCAYLHYSTNIKPSGNQCKSPVQQYNARCSLLHYCHLQRPPSCPLITHPPCRFGSSPPCPDILLFSHWTSTEGLINVSPSHMQMPLEHDSLLISFCEPRWIKNIQDALLAARLPASECIKYPHFHSTHTHTHNQPPSPPYLYSSRRHQWITFMQNASITRKTKRPCQGGSCHRRRQTILRSAHLSCNQPIIWVYIRPLWHGNFLLLRSHFQRQ